MAAARQRTGSGRIGVVGPILAVLLTAAGFVLLHDAVARADGRPGRTWVAATVDVIDGAIALWWMVAAGIAVALIGLWLIVTGLRPRSRRTVAITSATGLFLRARDIARLASAAADDVDGVLSAASVASRRKVTVTVESDRDGVADLVRTAVEQRLATLARPVRVNVRVRARTRIAPREGS
jgi:hypothetical protein